MKLKVNTDITKTYTANGEAVVSSPSFLFKNTGNVVATVNGYELQPGDTYGDDSSQVWAAFAIARPDLAFERVSMYRIVFYPVNAGGGDGSGTTNNPMVQLIETTYTIQ